MSTPDFFLQFICAFNEEPTLWQADDETRLRPFVAF
jgi:hypothetical protein